MSDKETSMDDIERIKKYLEKSGKAIGVIFSFGRNNYEYDHEFFTCDDGESDRTAWDLEIRKMEDVGTFQADLDEAVELGLESVECFYNYQDD